jgi:hypothetical protein
MPAEAKASNPLVLSETVVHLAMGRPKKIVSPAIAPRRIFVELVNKMIFAP